MTDSQPRELRHVDDDLAALALGALGPTEREPVEAHLVACERCRAAYAEHLGVAESVRAANLVGGAPEPLWDRIAGELHRPRRTSRTVVPYPGFLAWTAAAAAALAIAVAGGWYAGSRGNDDTPAPSDLVDIPTDDLVFTLLNLERDSAAQGRIFMSSDRARGVVVITGLHRLDSQRQWGVWIVLDDSTRTLLGTFGVDADGTAIVPLRLSALPADYDTIYVALAISPVSRVNPGQQAGPDVMAGPLY